jgi:hypothetical protein
MNKEKYTHDLGWGAENLLTIKEMAEVLGRSESLLWRYANPNAKYKYKLADGSVVYREMNKLKVNQHFVKIPNSSFKKGRYMIAFNPYQTIKALEVKSKGIKIE